MCWTHLKSILEMELVFISLVTLSINYPPFCIPFHASVKFFSSTFQGKCFSFYSTTDVKRKTLWIPSGEKRVLYSCSFSSGNIKL